MKSIRSNAEQILRENYKGVEDKDAMSFSEWVKNESVSDPNFFYWLFPDAENLTDDFGNGMTEEQRNEFEEFVSAFEEEEKALANKKEKLLEKWIVVEITNADPADAIRVTRRENFQKMNYCKAYGDYGKMVDCEHAGCYAFYNYNSSIHSDFLLEVEKAFNVKIHGYFGDRHGMNFDSVQTFIDLVKELNEEDSEIQESFEYNPVDLVELKKFAESWKENNETHTEVTAWTFHDSHNFQTVVLEADDFEPDCVELEEDDQIEILLQMPETAPHMEGFNTSEETEDYIFRFDRWATNPWFCNVERK